MKNATKRISDSLWFILLSCVIPLFTVGCSDDDETSNGVSTEWVSNLPETIDLDVRGGSKQITLKWEKGIDASQVACIISEENMEWCDVKLEYNTLSVNVDPSPFARTAAITLIYDKDHKKVVRVNQKSDFSAFFSDQVCSKIKEGITDEEIENIPHEVMRKLAKALKEGEYKTEFRVNDFRPYQHPSVRAKLNKTSKYSLRDNPTGIYVNEGDEMYVYLTNVYEGAEISLMIQDLNGGYGNHQYINLKEGLNRIIAPIGGLMYIMNHLEEEIPLFPSTDEEKKAIADKTISAHFVFGKVNGYFDIEKHKTQDKWIEILNNATYQDIDVLGKYSHITWTVDQFKGNNVYDKEHEGETTDILRTIDNCDKLVLYEQQFLGLEKYGKMFNNRMHFCVDYTAKSPNASDYRTVYNAGSYYADIFCTPDNFGSRLWGPAHEVGHVNQTRPGLKWAGMTEVTNNLTVLHVQEQFGQTIKLQEKGNASVSNPVIENGSTLYKNGEFNKKELNLYDVARKLIIEGQRAHSLPNISEILRETQLVPFWQLKLYFIDALGQVDFYHDLYEYFRTHPSPSEEGKNAGMDQLDFVRQVCRISGYNMLDFFEKWGFLKSVNAQLNDYGNKVFIITNKQIEDLKEEINAAGYKDPGIDVTTITDDTWENFKI